MFSDPSNVRNACNFSSGKKQTLVSKTLITDYWLKDCENIAHKIYN